MISACIVGKKWKNYKITDQTSHFIYMLRRLCKQVFKNCYNNKYKPKHFKAADLQNILEYH